MMDLAQLMARVIELERALNDAADTIEEMTASYVYDDEAPEPLFSPEFVYVAQLRALAAHR